MNIAEELKERLASCIEQRDKIHKHLLMMDEYLRYVELQEEIAEVNKAVKALEHSCNDRYYGLQQAQAQLRGQ